MKEFALNLLAAVIILCVTVMVFSAIYWIASLSPAFVLTMAIFYFLVEKLAKALGFE